MIYCVEDDASIRELIVYTLKSTGYEALGFESGKEFFAALESTGLPQLVLLDVMLPDMDGLQILHRLRNSRATRAVPVILATAKGSEYDKVLGLDSGADDYIAKPFGMMELVSRVRAVLRRTQQEESDEVLQVGGVILDIQRRTVVAGGRPVQLTLKEFELLQYLMRNTGIVLTRDRILETVWQYDFDGETRTVDVHVRTLRQKLGDCQATIETVRGVGYSIKGQP